MLVFSMVRAEPGAAQLAQRAADVQDIQNVMGWHVWYHAHYLSDVELDKVWVSTRPYVDTAVWAQNSNTGRAWMRSVRITAKVDPKTQAGAFQFHTLTSPIIVIADDRKTAKGVWYTPGMVGGYRGGSWLWSATASISSTRTATGRSGTCTCTRFRCAGEPGWWHGCSPGRRRTAERRAFRQ
jgi:hypothetical protein